VTAVANATNGTVSLSGGAITFTADPELQRAAQFGLHRVGRTTTDVGTVTVTVTPVKRRHRKRYDDT